MHNSYDNLEKQAEQLENQSKEEFNKKNYIIAISLLNEAKEIYKQLQYGGKISLIEKLIARYKNLMAYEKHDTYVKNRENGNFQNRVEKVIYEKKRYENKQIEMQKEFPIEIKEKLEKVELLKEKAEKEENLGKVERAKARYEYIIELYKSIPKEKINLAFEILDIEKKISSLGNNK